MLNQITPLILTYNEAPNIERTLTKLSWAQRIVVLDSFSTDETEALCRRFPQVEFVQRRFDNHTAQWNYGLSQIRTDWVLTLDADYLVTDDLGAELSEPRPLQPGVYCAQFKYCVCGRPLRGSLYPPRPVLFRPSEFHYEPDGHTQKLALKGAVGWLRGAIWHDDRKPLSHWLWAQDRYAQLEVTKLLHASSATLGAADRLRRIILPAPFVVLLYTLFFKGLIFEGWPGWFYAFQRTFAELLLSLRLLEAKLKAPPDNL